MKANVTYVHHSGYKIQIDDVILIFDYIGGDLGLENADPDKKIYFFVSHAHGDHFSPKIFGYDKQVCKYVLSFDIMKGEKHRERIAREFWDKTVVAEKNDEFEVDGMQIRTLTSTDEGVAFVVGIGGKNIFYAGDLNDWYWEMEDDEHHRATMHGMFAKEINKLKDIKIDIAMFPVDGRLQGQYDLGGSQVLRLGVGHFFPMHFWGEYKITAKFKQKYENVYKNTGIYEITKDGENFEIILT